jgi:HK97 gp10 family phage protein
VPWTVSVVKNLIPQVRASIEDKSEDAARKQAEHARDSAHDNAPRRTGALAESFYVNGPKGESGYSEAAGKAADLNPKAKIVPELQASIIDPKLGQLRDTVTGRFTSSQAIVASAVEYSLYVEEGTVHMSPRPILRNAALTTEKLFIDAMSKVADGF